ncbi:hypothetical protein CHS0354_025944 [Potamilus streckersoni]|uniref:Uncharacterized protein n=1 Tax=Potamilus streckersoni TaxID=2493646 RepID=A0AAE0T404_9BIVA|nr:hypothetical protein CHS0354_025944 [Potamilus streckersoni]
MSNIITILCAQAILAYNQVSSKESSACYGTNIACNFYSLECKETELIRLNTLQYGYKRGKDCYKSDEACKGDGGCCRYDKSDCTNKLHGETLFDIYTNCSGKSTCGPFQAPWVGMSYCGPMSEVITSDYLTINYECIDKKENLDICDIQKLLSDHVYLILDGSKKTSANFSPEGSCFCTFTGIGMKSVTSIAVTILDVRLAKSGKRPSDCTSTRFKIQNETFVKKCTLGRPMSNFYQNLNLEYILTNDTLDISLEGMNNNETFDYPALIWLQVKESPWNRTLESEIGNEGNLRTKTTYQDADTSDVKANVLAGVMTPLILGILMTALIILVTFVTCRSKRSDRHMMGTTEVTCIDVESETETPIKSLTMSKEASSDSEMELTQLSSN